MSTALEVQKIPAYLPVLAVAQSLGPGPSSAHTGAGFIWIIRAQGSIVEMRMLL